MPPLPSVANVAQILLRGTLGSDVNINNKFHCRFTGSPSVADCINWALAVTNSWKSELAPLISSSYTMNDVTVTDLTSATGSVGQDVANSAGTNSGGSVPNDVSLILGYEIARRYRGGHPKQFIAGLPSTSLLSTQRWSAATVSAWEAAYTLFASQVQAFSSANVQASALCNVSYISGHNWVQDTKGNWHRDPIYRATPLTDVVTSYIVNPVIGSQRRRNEQP